MKQIYSVFCMLMAFQIFAAEPVQPQDEVKFLSDPDMLLARVNGKPVFFRDVSEIYAKNIRDIRDNSAQLSTAIHDYLVKSLAEREIEKILMLEEADRLGIKADEARAGEIFSKFRARFDNDESYSAYLKNIGITENQARQKVEERLKISAFQEQLFRDISVTENDARTFYAENEALINPGEQFMVAQIMLYYPENSADPEKKLLDEKMNAIREKLISGADFAKTAAEVSQGVTAKDGGLIGWMDDKKIDRAIIEELKKIKPGDITPVIVTQSGVHILKLIDYRPAAPKRDFNAIKENIILEMTAKQKQDKFSSCIEKLRKDAKIEELYPQAKN